MENKESGVARDDASSTEEMLIACFDARIERAIAKSESRYRPRDSEDVARYNAMLQNLFETNDISHKTKFSELIRRFYRSPVFAALLQSNSYLAQSIFEGFLEDQDDEVKRFKSTGHRSACEINAAEEKEEGEV